MAVSKSNFIVTKSATTVEQCPAKFKKITLFDFAAHRILMGPRIFHATDLGRRPLKYEAITGL